MSLDRVVLREELQSSNSELLAGTIIEFDDLDNSRNMIIETLNAQIGESNVKMQLKCNESWTSGSSVSNSSTSLFTCTHVLGQMSSKLKTWVFMLV